MTRSTALLLALLTAAHASPITPGEITVIDGDTIKANGETYRLVGFDTPETGSRARCEAERSLGAAATLRHREDARAKETGVFEDRLAPRQEPRLLLPARSTVSRRRAA